MKCAETHAPEITYISIHLCFSILEKGEIGDLIMCDIKFTIYCGRLWQDIARIKGNIFVLMLFP